MAFFAPGGTPGFNQALLKGGGPPSAQPLASQVGKTDTSHRHDNTSLNNTLVFIFFIFYLSIECFGL